MLIRENENTPSFSISDKYIYNYKLSSYLNPGPVLLSFAGYPDPTNSCPPHPLQVIPDPTNSCPPHPPQVIPDPTNSCPDRPAQVIPDPKKSCPPYAPQVIPDSINS
jgi:hypothetical protein